MGLDMYLRANEYVSRYDYKPQMQREENAIFAEIVKQFNVEDVIDKESFAGISIDFPMGYWRKANQIHQWFVDNLGEGVDDCRKIGVSREQLEQLKKDCQAVLENHDLAEDLLPTGEGFFFGSTEYDEWYFGHLQETLEIIERCLNSKYEYFDYQASW